MKKRARQFITYFQRSNNLTVGVLLIVLFCVLFTNTFHESYPDEFDNILGGWYTLQGKIIYSDWFTHHNPVAYWISALIEIVSGQSFVRFRIIYSLLLFAYFAGIFVYFSKSFGREIGRVFLAFSVVVAFASTYFWGQMLLADNLAAYLFTPVFAILFLRTLYNLPLTRGDLIIISLFTFLGIFSSLTYAFLVVGMYAYTAYLYLRQSKFQISKKLISPILILAAPIILLFLYFLLTGSLGDYVYQAVIFNGKYYVYNYPGHQEGVGFVNPVRYAIVIFYNFFNNFTVLLIQITGFNFAFPFNITLALANVSTIIYLILRRKFLLALFLFFYIAYANVRSNPLTSKETDYQSAVYIVVSLFNLVFVLYALYRFLSEKIFDVRKVILFVFFVTLSLYGFFFATYILRSYGEKTFNKFMGFQPLIYDRPTIAPVINAITEEDDIVWIGPFAFEDLFYTNRDVPSKYHILIPGLGVNNETEREMVKEFRQNPPTVMYFDPQFFILGRSPEMYAEQFLQFVNDEYVTVVNAEGGPYRSIPDVTTQFNLETKLYIRRDAQKSIIERLLENEYIRHEE